MICSDETEDSLVSLFKMISENDMRTFMEEQGKFILSGEHQNLKFKYLLLFISFQYGHHKGGNLLEFFQEIFFSDQAQMKVYGSRSHVI